MAMAEQGRRMEWSRLSSAERAGLAEEAGRALAGGGLVVMPTETVYGVAASVASRDALARLWRATGRAEGSPVAWHALEAEPVLGEAGEVSDAWRFIARRLTPGPVTLQIPVRDSELAGLSRSIGVEAGAMVSDGELLLRVPSDEVARAVLDEARAVVGAVSASRGAMPTRVPDRGWAGDERIDVTIDAGPTRWKGASTGVRLVRGGGYEVVREGALRARDVERVLRPTILFVCSGNTCRSPMAEAMANAEIGRLFEGLRRAGLEGPVARSAGVWTGGGAPATQEGVESLRRMGVTAARHSSRGLTREMVLDAAAIFGMTAAHVEAIVSLAPEAAGRASMLDPGGSDVPDPVGGGQAIYDEAARRIGEHVRHRVAALARAWIGATT